jgi:putative MFS transporter
MNGKGGILYRNRTAFVVGVVAVTVGVGLHLPMYLQARDMHYVLRGMAVDAPMLAGMALIVAGLALAAYGLILPASARDRSKGQPLRVEALDDAPLSRAHVGLLLVLAAAVTIDVMKPSALGFVVPGMAREYGLKSPLNPAGDVPVSLLPLFGISGTVVGSFAWGWLGDRVGRRSSMLLAGLIFIGTSICGCMPSYQWNFAMCFLMGVGVGGMFPIAFTLLAETIPRRHRGWVLVLIGGDVMGAYFITSWLASALTPEFGWRILWLIGLPTGLALVMLNRWMPESARFLLAHGRDREAREVMARYGARVVDAPRDDVPTTEAGRWRVLGSSGFRGSSAIVVALGVGVGFMTFGFQLWAPVNLQQLGFSEITSDKILRDSALIGLPLTVVVAWLYGRWSSRGTLLVLGSGSVLALASFVVAGDDIASRKVLLYGLLAIVLGGASSVLAVLTAYSTEVYPTAIRSRGAGLAAGASKAGGVLILALIVSGAAPPSLAQTALLAALPLALGVLSVALYGRETRGRRLEEVAGLASSPARG